MHRSDSSSSFTSHTRQAQDPTKRYDRLLVSMLWWQHTISVKVKKIDDDNTQEKNNNNNMRQYSLERSILKDTGWSLRQETGKGNSLSQERLYTESLLPLILRPDRQTDEMTRQMLLLMDIKWYSPSGRVYNSAAVLGQTEGAFHSIPMNHRPVASSSSWLHSNGLMGVVLCIIVIALCS